MAIILSVFRAQVDGLLSALDTELSQLRRERLIKAALERYSQDRPAVTTEDITGDDGQYYGIAANLTNWSEGLSYVKSIQYPAPTVASDEAPIYLDAEDWVDDYWASGTRYLYFLNHSPATTETIRVEYAGPYAWSASTTSTAVGLTGHGFQVDDYLYLEEGDWYEATDSRIATHQVSAVADVDNFTVVELQVDLPVVDFFAVCNLAAGLCAQAIADRYSRTSDSTIRADSVDHLSRADQWSRRARELIDLYKEHMGLLDAAGNAGAGGRALPEPAGQFIKWDIGPDDGSRRYLFHHRDR